MSMENGFGNETDSYLRYGNRTNVAATGTAADSSPIPLDGVPNLAYDNATNRITTTGYEYDAAGNQIKAPDASGNGLLLEYDAANRVHIIKKESDSSYVQAFQYGSTNARVMDMDYGYGYLKIFASVGGTTLAEYTEHTHTVPTWTKSYTYFGDTQLATVTPNGTGGEFTEFNHADRLGTRLMTNQAGGTAYEQVTLPFGTALNAESSVTTNNRRFTSYDRSNATGFDYAINRTYDSKQGRFTQVDPIGMSAVSLASPQTLNMYTYCGNDPINRVDPDGLFWGTLLRWLGRILGFISRNRRTIANIISVALVFAPQGVRTIAGPLAGILSGNMNLGSGFAGAISVEIGRSVDRILNAMAAAVGAIANNFAQQDDKRKRKKRSKIKCPPSLTKTFYFSDFYDVYEKALTDMKEHGHEEGGWIYQDEKTGKVFARRRDRHNNPHPKETALSIMLMEPPTIKGARVVGTFHTHPGGLGPSGEFEDLGDGWVKASGDHLINHKMRVPGMVLTRPKNSSGQGYEIYGPGPGILNIGLPDGCKR